MASARQFRCCLCAVLAIAAPLSAQVSSSKTVRHHRVPVADQSQPPELAQAESALEKKDYASAEPLLKKVVAAQAGNYQAWFDLGFLYNAIGKTDDSIAAYRRAVEAKPDLFESNLSLGLILAKNKRSGAEEYLQAATRLKPQSRVDEGHARAWLGLARLLEESDPDRALEAYRQASTLQPNDPNHAFQRAGCSKAKTSFPMPRHSTSKPSRSIPHRKTRSSASPISTCEGKDFPKLRNTSEKW